MHVFWKWIGNSQFIIIKVAHHFYEMVRKNPLPTLSYMDYEVLEEKEKITPVLLVLLKLIHVNGTGHLGWPGNLFVVGWSAWTLTIILCYKYIAWKCSIMSYYRVHDFNILQNFDPKWLYHHFLRILRLRSFMTIFLSFFFDPNCMDVVYKATSTTFFSISTPSHTW